jgi:hypothetical protein
MKRPLANTASHPTSNARARKSKSVCGPNANTGIRRVAAEDFIAATHSAQGIVVLFNSWQQGELLLKEN